MAGIPVTGRRYRVLDFDIENRPLTYYGDRPTADITVIAWKFSDEEHVRVVAQPWDSLEQMMRAFREAYDRADLVTGHYIRRHDLPIMNGHMVELGFGCMSSKLSSDTKLDLVKWQDVPKSQQHLAEMLGVDEPKPQMSQQDWRDANRLTEDGVYKAIERCEGDVLQHIALRKVLLEQGLLKGPRMWSP